MRAVMPSLLPDVEALRKRTGADQWDEVWDGVLHMPPMPNEDHQRLERDLLTYLNTRWGRAGRGEVLHQVNLAPEGAGETWRDNYRIPDIVLVKPDRFGIRCGSHFEGAPNVVIEIHSPDDEAYEKLPFYFDLGIPEVWIIDRDTCRPEMHVPGRSGYRKLKADSKGWLVSAETGVELRRGPARKLRVRMDGDPKTQEDLPSD